MSTIEYYVQAIDDAYQSERTSTYQITCGPKASASSLPWRRDPARASPSPFTPPTRSRVRSSTTPSECPASPLSRPSRPASRPRRHPDGRAPGAHPGRTRGVGRGPSRRGSRPRDRHRDHREVRVDLRNAGTPAAGPLEWTASLREPFPRERGRRPSRPARRGRSPFLPSRCAPPGRPCPLPSPRLRGSARRAPTEPRAYLLIALEEAPPPGRTLTLAKLALGWAGAGEVDVESADGPPHAVRLRLEGPRGLRAHDPEDESPCPARRRPVPVRLLRGTLPDTVQGVLAVATTSDGPAARTTVTAGSLRVLPDPAWLPRFRKPLLLLTLLLLGAAAFADAWKRLA